MNCNSNTVPLIEGDGNNLNCNNGCVPKDINVICRKIIIPFGQNVLAIQGENNSNTRTFIVPKINESGEDLSTKTFSILTKNSMGVIEVIEITNPEILENYIKIVWNISETNTSQSGTLTVQIQATSTDYVWKTFPAKFVIADSL